MSQLEEALAALHGHPGVEHLLLLGTDGLIVRHLGDAGLEVDRVSAMLPEVAAAGASLGRAGGLGAFGTGVLEFEGGVAIVTTLSAELLLALLLRPGVGFAPLLRHLRHERPRLVGLL